MKFSSGNQWRLTYRAKKLSQACILQCNVTILKSSTGTLKAKKGYITTVLLKKVTNGTS